MRFLVRGFVSILIIVLMAFSAQQGKAVILNSQSPKSSMFRNVRVELFFRDVKELRERVQFLASNGIKSYNVVNKNNKDDLMKWLGIIHEEIPGSDVCIHYSLKYNKSRKQDGSYLRFRDALEEMTNHHCEGDFGSKSEVLLVTGSGPKGNFDSVAALQRLNAAGKLQSRKYQEVAMAVAFNPFFQNEEDLNEEKERLMKKIKTGKVHKIYLQFGTDIERLRFSLDWLSELRKDHNNLSICGSIFLPTKKLIAQQKFRPWNGVFLSDEFLSGEKEATRIVQNLIKLYNDFGCGILFEAPGVRNEKDMIILKQLVCDRQSNALSRSSNNLDFVNNSKEASKVSPGMRKAKRKRPYELKSSPQVSEEDLEKPAVLLFGNHDVRVHDNIALQLASFHSTIIPVFIWSRKDQGKWGIRGAAEVVLKDAIKSLSSKFEHHDMKLIYRVAEDSANELRNLCEQYGAGTVYFNKDHTPESREREQNQRRVLQKDNVRLIECQSSLLYDPLLLSLPPGFRGGHWGTLMPFLKGCKSQIGEPRRPIQRCVTVDLLNDMKGPKIWPDSDLIDSSDLAEIRGIQKWDEPIRECFPMSEEKALADLNNFFETGFQRYERDRNRADNELATSKLSVHLRIGTLSPNELYYMTEDSVLDYDERKTFSRRLFWRDLAYFQLLNFPSMREYAIRTHYDKTEWVSGSEEKLRFDAWRKGKTGYPLVDAGMRELYKTGWMTQSVRMVVASFLTEYLRVNWVKGCEWFHYTLVDADSAINAMMWQNAGRSGIDQWNFVMSPVAASQDVTGSYTRKWVPELSSLPKAFLHKPWEAPQEVLNDKGIILGETYPERIVEDLNREKEISDSNVLKMRKKHPQFNDSRGYDLINIDGQRTVVFTKKQFRIDKNGILIKETKPSKKAGRKPDKRGRRGQNRRGRR